MKGFNEIPIEIGKNYCLIVRFKKDDESYFEILNCVILEAEKDGKIKVNQYVNFHDVITNNEIPKFIERKFLDSQVDIHYDQKKYCR